MPSVTSISPRHGEHHAPGVRLVGDQTRPLERNVLDDTQDGHGASLAESGS